MNALVTALVVGIVVLLLSVFVDRILIPFRARRTVEKLLKKQPGDSRFQVKPPDYLEAIAGQGAAGNRRDPGPLTGLLDGLFH